MPLLASNSVYSPIMVLEDTYPTTSSPTTVVFLELILDPCHLHVDSGPSHFTSKIYPLALAFYREEGPKARININMREYAVGTNEELEIITNSENNPNPPDEITTIAF